jgi:hypothetical protein
MHKLRKQGLAIGFKARLPLTACKVIFRQQTVVHAGSSVRTCFLASVSIIISYTIMPCTE